MPPQGQPSPTAPATRILPYTLILAGLATVLFGLSFCWNAILQDEGVINTALTLARTSLQKDIIYRRWSSQLGGVYGPAVPNPYLKAPERDITTPSGQRLTLINPAYMTRQVHEMQTQGTGIKGRITSLNPIRPANAPDPWERRALLKVEAGAQDYHQIKEDQGQRSLRLLAPLYVEKNCLRCHQEQDYRLGQLRGGMSVTVPLAALEETESHEVRGLLITHLFLWAITLLAILVMGTKLQRRIDERDQARREAHTLSGLLPICSHCKKIRDSQGQWQPLESYIAGHSEADFSHGLCPECLAKYYPEVHKDH